MASTIGSINLDTTIAALQQDISAIPVEDAIALIEGWQKQLKGTDLAEDLGELKQALLNGNTSEIADILSDLGEDTSEAAASASDTASASKIEQLGSMLSQAGESLM